MMTKNILIVGVGGQGTLLASKVMGKVFLDSGYDVKVSEVHGMSQRGGSVVTYVRYGDEVYSTLIDKGEADILLSFEALEAARWLPYLKKDGWVITNTEPFVNIPDYPDLDTLMQRIEALPHHVALDVAAIASEASSPRAANIVLLGAAAPFLGIDIAKIEDGIHSVFARKGDDIVEMNIKAFRAGLKVAHTHINGNN